MDKKISEKVISRLTLYHCILREFITKEQEYISSKQIATLLRIDDKSFHALSFALNYSMFRLS